jgi:hypothetical protein
VVAFIFQAHYIETTRKVTGLTKFAGKDSLFFEESEKS